MGRSGKRRAETGSESEAKKKHKSGRQWRVARKNPVNPRLGTSALEVGDSGIWVACDRGSERKCAAEMKDLFNEYSAKLYNESDATQDDRSVLAPDGEGDIDIEAEIATEITNLKQSAHTDLFQPVKTDMDCLLFIKTRLPVRPTELVHRICSDARLGILGFRGRFIKRLTPVTMFGKANENGLQELCRQVLGPHFHADMVDSQKFAIRPTLRHHDTLDRDTVIKSVAEAVGPRHSVDLKNYDKCILVEIYKNLCGMSVVGSDYESLKRFNLSELWLAYKAEQGSKEAKSKDEAGEDEGREN